MLTWRPSAGAFAPRFTEAEEEEIARIAEADGWLSAAHDYMRSRNQAAYRLAVDEYIAQLRFLLPLAVDASVLHLGYGWGALSLNLASCTTFVVMMDDRHTRLRFVSARQKAAGLASMRTVCGSPSSSLPIRDSMFDAVIVSDVPGHVSKDHSVMRAALCETRRVLRPGGWLLVTLSNAFAPWLSGSYWSSRASVREAGFTDVQFYAPLPSHREPFFIVPLERPRLTVHLLDTLFTAASYRARLEARGLGTAFALARSVWYLVRAARLTRLLRCVVPSYCIVARA